MTEDIKQVNCEICNRTLQISSGLAFHLLKSHNINKVDLIKKYYFKYYKFKGDKKDWREKQLTHNYKTEVNHNKKEFNVIFKSKKFEIKCLICNDNKKVFKTQQYLTIHLKRIHKFNDLQILNNYYSKYFLPIDNIKNKQIKIITEDKIIECLLCNKKINKANDLHSHLKGHDILSKNDLLQKYYLKYFKSNYNIKKLKKCNFCNKELAEFKLNVDYVKKIFELNYNGFICNSSECRKKRIEDFCGGNESKYEFIGSNIDFLSIKFGVSCEEAKKLKTPNTIEIIKKHNPGITDKEALEILKKKKEDHNKKPHRTNLQDYILRNGVKEGTKKYNERNKKIGFANTLQYYIEKYGENEGIKNYKIRLEKKRISHLTGKKVSDSSSKLKNFLIKHNYKFEEEYPITTQNKSYFVDFYIPKYNCILEFFGDFWHCNPKVYNENYYNKILKLTSKEKIDKDKKRIELIKNFDLNNKIIIFWESSQLNEDELNRLIKSKKRNKVTYI